MIEKLREIDVDLRDLLCKNLYEGRVANKSDIVEISLLKGYEERVTLDALDVFLYCGLIDQPQILIPGFPNIDFLIVDARYNELKAKGFL